VQEAEAVVEHRVRVEQAAPAGAETARLMQILPETAQSTREAVVEVQKRLLALAVTVAQDLSCLEFQQAQVLASPVG
jgi:hypothetical protein